MGVDPAMFGSLLAIDMGGYQLAKDLAEDPLLGSYGGLVVAAVFGCTIVFTIPVGMGMISKADRPFFAQGIMVGLAAMPVGLAVGGMLCGLSILTCLHQNLPIFVLALLLLLGLWKIPQKMVKGFCLLAEGIRWLVTIGLVLAAVESLTGWAVLPGMAPLEDAMATVASIGIVLLGSLPLAELIRRILTRPFAWLGERLGMKPQSLTAMLVGLVSALPTLSMYQDMDDRGKVAAGAFLVSGTSLLAAHMAFTVSTEPNMLGPLIGAKLAGAFAAVVAALWVTRKTNQVKN
ncbi:ethanolamine utilization protein EutH [Clostridium sp. CAG:1013]|nr:ethanolamine utilization protein EutH [Clostridium sp. CAG:1013]